MIPGILGIPGFSSPPAATSGDIEDLFANGEIGDYWRFDADNTDATIVTDPITAATGLVNGRILEDADPGHLPTLTTVSGYQAADFTAPSDRLFHNFGSTVAQPGTIIICLNSTSNLDGRAIVTGSGTTLRWQISVDGSFNVIGYAGASLDSTRNTAIGTKVLTVEFNGSSGRFRVNGEGVNTDVSGNIGTQGTDRLTVGSLWDGTNGLGINVFSLIFIDRILTSTELDGAERLLGSHAGLTW